MSEIKKLGFASVPIKNDTVTVVLASGSNISGDVVAWDLEGWGQSWAVIKESDDTLVQVNLSSIAAFSVSKKVKSPDFEVVKKATDEEGNPVYDDEGERVKVAKKVAANPNPKYRIVRRGARDVGFSKEIPEDKKIVSESTLSLDENLANKHPIDQAQALVDLYEEKRRLVSEGVKDHLTSKDLKEPDDVYAMPGFKKRPKTET